jgi:hypothetical protein
MDAELTPEYVETLRRMTGPQKLEAAFALWHAARRLKAAAIRERHPDWTDERVEQELREIFLRAGD